MSCQRCRQRHIGCRRQNRAPSVCQRKGAASRRSQATQSEWAAHREYSGGSADASYWHFGIHGVCAHVWPMHVNYSPGTLVLPVARVDAAGENNLVHCLIVYLDGRTHAQSSSRRQQHSQRGRVVPSAEWLACCTITADRRHCCGREDAEAWRGTVAHASPISGARVEGDDDGPARGIKIRCQKLRGCSQGKRWRW